MVSKPKISWNCVNKTLTCEILDGTDPQLKLSQKGRQLGSILQKVLTHKWTSKLPTEVTCTAKNSLSEKSTVTAISCSEKGLNIYLIIGTCVAGTLLMVFVALLIFYISRRKKQNRRKNDHVPRYRSMGAGLGLPQAPVCQRDSWVSRALVDTRSPCEYKKNKSFDLLPVSAHYGKEASVQERKLLNEKKAHWPDSSANPPEPPQSPPE
ncbi:T-cell surface antigen CD2 [Tupaia chinensis]|uniref:T-cell surface antigen CD2 n=1 Tax=Tupaia chinensis TaxID=246437 RepID=L8YG81_TUPCH|nr:T-cell surface antigen CD2 [Tupaia chinensis]